MGLAASRSLSCTPAARTLLTGRALTSAACKGRRSGTVARCMCSTCQAANVRPDDGPVSVIAYASRVEAGPAAGGARPAGQRPGAGPQLVDDPPGERGVQWPAQPLVFLALLVEHPVRLPVGRWPGVDAVMGGQQPAPLPQLRVPGQLRRLVVPQHRQPVARPGGAGWPAWPGAPAPTGPRRPDRPHRETARPGQARQPSPLRPACSPPS
jgi:hypothetical protein